MKAVVDTVDAPDTRTMESDWPGSWAVLAALPGVALTRTAQQMQDLRGILRTVVRSKTTVKIVVDVSANLAASKGPVHLCP